MSGRRSYGNIRKLPSGRYQARHHGEDGTIQPAPQTFERKRDAELWLAHTASEQARGTWVDTTAGRVLLREYGMTWIAERPHLAETTRERYQHAWRVHIAPTLADAELRAITDAVIRRWYSDLLGTTGRSSAAKAYRLLKSILNTAVGDDLIRRNPCRIKGAGVERPAERPILDIPQVMRLAQVIDPRFQALVLMATFTSLRFGELAALTRKDLDVATPVVHVRRNQVELSDGRLLIKTPKTEAGKRTVHIPTAILPSLAEHLERYAAPGPDGRVFVGELGGVLRRQNFRKLWLKANRGFRHPARPLPRPAPHREHPGRRVGGQPSRTHGPYGAHIDPRRADLSARHGITRPCHRRFAQRCNWRRVGRCRTRPGLMNRLTTTMALVAAAVLSVTTGQATAVVLAGAAPAYTWQAWFETLDGQRLSSPDKVHAADVESGYRLRGSRRLTNYIYNSDELVAVLARCSNPQQTVVCQTVGRVGVRIKQYAYGGSSTRWKYSVDTRYISGPRYEAQFDYRCARNIKREPDNYCDSYPADRADGPQTVAIQETPGSLENSSADLNADFGRAVKIKKYALIKVIVRWDDYGATARGEDGQPGLKFRTWDTTRFTAEDTHLETLTGTGY